MINLNNCKPGQKLRARNGEILTYISLTESSFYPHVIQYKSMDRGTRTNAGHIHSDLCERDYDIVEIIEEDKMKTEITELENELKLAEEKAASIKLALEAKRKLELEIKVGDYVVCTDDFGAIEENMELKVNMVYRVTYVNKVHISVDRMKWNSSRFRKATREEIAKHLLDEAAKKGFIVGARISYGKFDIYNIIQKLEVLFNSKDIDMRNNSASVGRKTDFPFVIAYCKSCSVFPIDDFTIVKDEISIEVNGVKYIAKFLEQNQVVNFGCANIAFSIFESAYKFMHTATDNPANNRYVEYIQIGNGKFNLELITKIYNKILELSIKV